MQITRFFNNQMVRILTLALVGFVVYGASLGNGFVLDDESQIVANDLTTSLDHLGEIFINGSSTQAGGRSSSYGIYYRPIMLASFAVLRSSFGLDGRAFHGFQLLLHIANAIFLSLIFEAFFTSALSFFAGLLFLLHPLNVEAVCYSASLQDPLFAVFALAGLLILFKSKKFSFWHVLSVAVLFLCSLLSKETGLVLIAVGVIGCALFCRPRLIKASAGCALAVAVYLIFRLEFAHLAHLEFATSQLARASLLERVLTVPMVLASYLGKFLWPQTLASSQDWVIRSATFSEFWLPLTAVSIATLFGFWFALRKFSIDRRILFFMLWTSGGLLLHSQTLVLLDGTVSERWFYVPGMGLIGLTVCLLEHLRPWLTRHSRASVAGGAVILIAFAARAGLRALDWHDGFTLYSADIASQADSPTLQNNLGVELFRHSEIASAKDHFEKSIALNSSWNVSWSNLGAVYHHQGDLARAEECYRKSMQFGAYLLSYQNLALVLMQQGKRDEALKFLRETALLAFPGDATLLRVWSAAGGN